MRKWRLSKDFCGTQVLAWSHKCTEATQVLLPHTPRGSDLGVQPHDLVLTAVLAQGPQIDKTLGPSFNGPPQGKAGCGLFAFLSLEKHIHMHPHARRLRMLKTLNCAQEEKKKKVANFVIPKQTLEMWGGFVTAVSPTSGAPPHLAEDRPDGKAGDAAAGQG